MISLLRVDPLLFVIEAASLVIAITLHEFSHAYVADLQGDRLPRAMGRVSLNPARHLDPLGTLFLVLFSFGWGKPVELRTQALSSKRFGPAAVALAGPAMNLLLALAGALLFRFVADPFTRSVVATFGQLPPQASQAATFAFFFASINVLLAVFNLLPLPPLDGSRLLTILLPPSRQHIVFWLDRYGFLVLLAVVFFGGLTLLGPLIAMVSRTLFALTGTSA